MRNTSLATPIFRISILNLENLIWKRIIKKLNLKKLAAFQMCFQNLSFHYTEFDREMCRLRLSMLRSQVKIDTGQSRDPRSVFLFLWHPCRYYRRLLLFLHAVIIAGSRIIYSPGSKARKYFKNNTGRSSSEWHAGWYYNRSVSGACGA